MTRTLIAALPFDVRPGEVEHNLRCVLEALEQAAGAGCGLLVLPEKWTTSFLESYGSEIRGSSERALQVVHEAARKLEVTVIGSAPGGDGDKPANELHLLGASGSLRPYRKRMLFSPTGEGRQVERGGGLPIAVETPVGRVLGVVCYDLRFPEVCRQAMYERADLFVCVAQWPWPRVPVFELMSRARAAENQVWTISCNRAGEATLGAQGNPMRFPGMALLVDPLGEVTARVDDGSLLLGELDLSVSEQVRKGVPLARDLKRAGLWQGP